MTQPYDTIQHRGYTINIYPDEDPPNPRTEFDGHLGKMVCWHRGYILGDEQPREDPHEYQLRLACELNPAFERWYERLDDRADLEKDDFEVKVRDRVQKILDQHTIILPLYLYEHSGITIRTSAFSCPWDSGQVGFIFTTLETIRKYYGIKRITKVYREMAVRELVAEVSEYDDCLTGNVFGYTIESPDGDDTVGGCWGFFGEPKNFLIPETKDEVDSHIQFLVDNALNLFSNIICTSRTDGDEEEPPNSWMVIGIPLDPKKDATFIEAFDIQAKAVALQKSLLERITLQEWFFKVTSQEYGIEEYGPYDSCKLAQESIERIQERVRLTPDGVERFYGVPYAKIFPTKEESNE
jgi:hypothetical protein